jgi:fructokinase
VTRSVSAKIIVGLGELLWDLLPDGPRLGGAPANFAVMAGRLGHRAVIASRIGSDDLAAQARQQLNHLPVDSGFLQIDPSLPTGTVSVLLEAGEPHYTIHEPAAWDRLTLTPEWRNLARAADAVCFGSLAQRSAHSRETILAFLDLTRSSCVRVFDVNLRDPFWSAAILHESLLRSTILKLNLQELPHLLHSTGICPFAPPPDDDAALLTATHRLLEHYPIHLACVTMGAQGSLIVARDDFHRHRGIATAVRDTVGAGDAFTAALTHYYLQAAPLPVLSEAANRWGAWIASQSGAMPEIPADLLAGIARLIDARRE